MDWKTFKREIREIRQDKKNIKESHKKYKAMIKHLKSLPIPEFDGIAEYRCNYRHVNTIDGFTGGAVGILIDGVEYEGLIMNPYKMKRYIKKRIDPKCLGFVKSDAVDMHGEPLYKLYIIDKSYN